MQSIFSVLDLEPRVVNWQLLPVDLWETDRVDVLDERLIFCFTGFNKIISKQVNLRQPCPNFTFDGGFLPADLSHIRLIFWDEIWYTDEGGQSRLSEFFWGQDSSWWLQNGDPKEKLYLRIVSNWKDICTKLKLFRELHTINIGPRNFIQLNWSTGWTFISNLPEKVWNFPLSVIRLLTIFFRFQENIQAKWNVKI
jgi:hypothetical protein